jgi:hypothetical protein
MAELLTVETPRMAWNYFVNLLTSTKRVTHRKNMTKLCMTGLLGHKSLSEELIHNVGKVGHDEDENHHH